MSLLDFKEIPESNIANGQQDAFEHFADAALRAFGFEIEDPPARGADLGKDLIALEEREGIVGRTTFRWLVSCKHRAHSGRAVGEEEQNLLDRVSGHRCNGFMCFYSTLPSNSLLQRLQQMSQFEHFVFSDARIEEWLLKSRAGIEVAKRYFPKSIHEWLTLRTEDERSRAVPAHLPSSDNASEMRQNSISEVQLQYHRLLLAVLEGGEIDALKRNANEARVQYEHWLGTDLSEHLKAIQTKVFKMDKQSRLVFGQDSTWRDSADPQHRVQMYHEVLALEQELRGELESGLPARFRTLLGLSTSG